MCVNAHVRVCVCVKGGMEMKDKGSGGLTLILARTLTSINSINSPYPNHNSINSTYR